MGISCKQCSRNPKIICRMLAFVKMIFRVRLYGVSRHEDGAKRNPNGQCGGKREALGGGSVCGIMWIYEIQERY